jgi:hypothetical protein
MRLQAFGEKIMKFIVRKGTETFDKLKNLVGVMQYCHEKAFDLIKELGYESWCAPRDFNSMAGGICGFIADKQPEGWRKLDKDIYFPIRNRKANKELLERIENLPQVKSESLNEILHFSPQIVEHLYISRPAFIPSQDYFLISINEKADYEPLPDMEEITFSEYKRLTEQLKEKEKLSNHQAA